MLHLRKWYRWVLKLKNQNNGEKHIFVHLKNRYSFSIELLSPLPSLVAQRVKCLPAMWETGFESGVRKAPLEKERASHSSTLAWKIPWMEEPEKLRSMGLPRVTHDWATSLYLSTLIPTSAREVTRSPEHHKIFCRNQAKMFWISGRSICCWTVLYNSATTE